MTQATPNPKRKGSPRFQKGNPGGPGNPHAATVAKYRAAILKATTPEDAVAVFRAMIEAAKDGDTKAAQIVLDRLLGQHAALLVQDAEGQPVGITFQIVRGE